MKAEDREGGWTTVSRKKEGRAQDSSSFAALFSKTAFLTLSMMSKYALGTGVLDTPAHCIKDVKTMLRTNIVIRIMSL
jgi:hypothetical protein